VPFHSEELLASPFELIRFATTLGLLLLPFYFLGRAAAIVYGLPGGPAGPRYAADLAGAAAGALAVGLSLGPLTPLSITALLSLGLLAGARAATGAGAPPRPPPGSRTPDPVRPSSAATLPRGALAALPPSPSS
jgi:hypothetical protein